VACAREAVVGIAEGCAIGNGRGFCGAGWKCPWSAVRVALAYKTSSVWVCDGGGVDGERKRAWGCMLVALCGQ
jgi:hypothetical protein